MRETSPPATHGAAAPAVVRVYGVLFKGARLISGTLAMEGHALIGNAS